MQFHETLIALYSYIDITFIFITMKNWIKEKAVKITEGYKNPFTGNLMDSRTYVHFKTFAIALEECEQYDSFDELLKTKLK